MQENRRSPRWGWASEDSKRHLEPKCKEKLFLTDEIGAITAEKEAANEFNNYFSDKIIKLKGGIDTTEKDDQLKVLAWMLQNHEIKQILL